VEADTPGGLAVYEAQLRRYLKELDLAVAIADSVLQGSADDRTKFAALVERGYALRDLDRRLEAFGALEKALEIDPTNVAVRFDLAYAYSQSRFKELAISHYEQLVGRLGSGSDRQKWTLNNMGAALSELNMPILAVRRFQESAAQDNGLAAANLAHLLLDRGFVDEARAYLANATAIDPDNARAASATARIGSETRAEEEALVEHRQMGDRFRLVFKQIGDGPTGLPPAGTFRLEDGNELTLEPDEQKMTAKLGDRSKISFAVDGGTLAVEQTAGLLALNKHNGRGHYRGGNLTYYLLDYPKSGESRVFRASLQATSQG
jgi:tetratricopeptide (TPR) repeat protein